MKNKTRVTKKAALEGLQELSEKILVLKTHLEAKEEELKLARKKNNCWWDQKPCPNYTVLRGFQEIGSLCDGCYRVDRKRFTAVLEEIASSFLKNFKTEDVEEEYKEVIEEAREEASNDAWQDIHEEIRRLISYYFC